MQDLHQKIIFKKSVLVILSDVIIAHLSGKIEKATGVQSLDVLHLRQLSCLTPNSWSYNNTVSPSMLTDSDGCD